MYKKNKKKELIVILSQIDWDFPCDYLKQTSLVLGEKAKVVLFNPLNFPSLRNLFLSSDTRKNRVLNLNKKKINYFPSIGYLPFQKMKAIENINRDINIFFFKIFCLLKNNFRKPLIWYFDFEIGKVISKFKWGKYFIYDRVDQSSAIDEKENLKIKKKDLLLLKKSNLVFVNSPYAYRFVKKVNQHVYLVPCGCQTKLFDKTKKEISLPDDLKKIKKPIIGLVGNLDERLDFKLIYFLAKKNPFWNFVFVGGRFTQDPFEKDSLKWFTLLGKLSNVYLLGKRPKETMPDYIAFFDVCLIPYNLSREVVRGCNPMKLYEYLAMGKPIVSTEIEAVKLFFPQVKFGKTAETFAQEIKAFLSKKEEFKETKARKKIAQQNSWEEKVNIMVSVANTKLKLSID